LTQPSIKGSVVVAMVEAVQKLLQSGAISEEELEDRLSSEAFELIQQPIAASRWYDIRAAHSLGKLLIDVAGHGDPDFMRGRGEVLAERLLKGGLYAQLEFVKRMNLDRHTDPKARFEAFGRDLRLVVTLGSSMFNFGRWAVRPDPERDGCYCIEVHEASALSDVGTMATEGFMNRLMKEIRLAARWCMERPRPDLVVYKMDQPLSVAMKSDSTSEASVDQSRGRVR
jgi:hypothetical protein